MLPSPAILLQRLTIVRMQIIRFIERILYATDEREAKEAMLDAQNLYPSSDD